jgi:predicted metal-dependent hydrolase
MERWYRKKAIELYEERMFACFEQFPNWFQDKYVIPEITVRKMRRRWGSCSRAGEVTLNLALIKMPIRCLDYVIVHELCHLEAFHHGKAFYRLLALVMPSWKEQENLIEQLS